VDRPAWNTIMDRGVAIIPSPNNGPHSGLVDATPPPKKSVYLYIWVVHQTHLERECVCMCGPGHVGASGHGQDPWAAWPVHISVEGQAGSADHSPNESC
jgi:hypothetical protein